MIRFLARAAIFFGSSAIGLLVAAWLAARDAEIEATDCWFVGDGESDMRASLAAGMKPVLATYGYVPDIGHARSWGAHHEIGKPLDLLGILPRLDWS